MPRIIVRTLLALAVIAVLAPISAIAETTEIDQEFDVKAGQELNLDFDRMRGDIEIEGWDQDKVHITGEIGGRDWEEGDELEIDQSSSGLDVAPSYRPHGDDRIKMDLVIKVPRKFDVRLRAAADAYVKGIEGDHEFSIVNSDLELEDVHGEGEVSAVNGRLTMKDCTIDGDISNVNGKLSFDNSDINGDISSVNGGIKVARASDGVKVMSVNGNVEVGSAGHITAKTTNGHVEIDELSGWIEAETVNGAVRFTMVGDPGGNRSVEIETLNGDVEIEIPENFSMDFDIEVKNEGGRSRYEIISDFDLDIESDDSRRGRYRMRGKGEMGGGKNTVVIRATNGDVILKKVASSR